jgi:hypothetical protein
MYPVAPANCVADSPPYIVVVGVAISRELSLERSCLRGALILYE